MQDVGRSAEDLRREGAQETDQRRPNQHELAFADPKMFDQPEFQSQKLVEQ